MPQQKSFRVKCSRDDHKPPTFHFHFPTSLDEAISRFDKPAHALGDVVFRLFLQQLRQQVIHYARTLLLSGKHDLAEIQTLLDNYVPRANTRSAQRVTSLAKQMKKMTAEEQEILLKTLGVSGEGGE